MNSDINMKSNIDQPIGSVQCYAIYMNNHIFFLNSTDVCSIPGNEIGCSSVQSDGRQLIFSEPAGSAISAQLP